MGFVFVCLGHYGGLTFWNGRESMISLDEIYSKNDITVVDPK